MTNLFIALPPPPPPQKKKKKKSRRPVKAALAAASEHLAGLLPLHLVYSQAHETAIEVCHLLWWQQVYWCILFNLTIINKEIPRKVYLSLSHVSTHSEVFFFFFHLSATWQDWAWSVGCNPFSITSQGWHISQFQSDTIARSYIITTLEESIQLVNSAVHLLLMERTSILSCSFVTNEQYNVSFKFIQTQ